MGILDSIFGKPTKKQLARERLDRIRRKGKAGEDQIAMRYALSGYEVERTGRGSDFRVRRRNLFTGRVVESKLIEIKTGRAKLSKLQKKTKRKHRNYKVVRADPLFY